MNENIKKLNNINPSKYGGLTTDEMDFCNDIGAIARTDCVDCLHNSMQNDTCHSVLCACKNNNEEVI